MNAAGAAKEEERAFPCDKCHEEPGVWLYDQFWLCDHCRALYEAKLAYESIPDKAGDR